MQYTWYKLRRADGVSIQHPPSMGLVEVDLSDTEAIVFRDDHVLGHLRVFSVEMHAMGIRLRGVEEKTATCLIFQEWWLAYPAEKTSCA